MKSLGDRRHSNPGAKGRALLSLEKVHVQRGFEYPEGIHLEFLPPGLSGAATGRGRTARHLLDGAKRDLAHARPPLPWLVPVTLLLNSMPEQ